MNRTSRMFTTLSVALLLLIVYGNDAIVSVGAEPQNARNAKSTSPARSKHYRKHTFKAKDGTAIDYWVMSPVKIEEGRQYPLVLALHGRGGSTVAAKELASNALREQYPCFVMAPVSTRAGHWARPVASGKRRKKGKSTKSMLPVALEAMEAFIKKQPINPNRVYVTGQSMGGVGTFGAVSLRPDVFAAAIPVCGGWDPQDAGKMKNIAIWAFHGGNDKVVPTEFSRNMIAAIKQAGGSPKYTEYAGVAHNSWSKTYASSETWKWLFQQTRTHRSEGPSQTNP